MNASARALIPDRLLCAEMCASTALASFIRMRHGATCAS